MTLLFGSRADGSAKSDSDYDIVFIISESSLTSIQRAQKAHRALMRAEIYTPADLFLFTPQEFEQEKILFHSIPEIASNVGVEVPLDPP